MTLFRKKRSRWERLVRPAAVVAIGSRVVAPVLRAATRPAVKTAAGVTGAAVAATAASAAASSRRGES
jgi:hypothetical protein